MPLNKLNDLGLTLPTAPKPLGVYVPAVRSGSLVFVSGQLPLVEGKLPAEFTGKLGELIDVDAGKVAARLATLNGLAIIHDLVGLENVKRIVRLVGHVASAPDFTQQPLVVNAASELLGAVFGDAGIHARLALGTVVLPLDACLEIELIVEV